MFAGFTANKKTPGIKMFSILRTKSLNIFLLVLLIQVLSSSASADPSADTNPVRDISGIVIDAKSGETIPNANVVLLGTDLGASTNLDGHFVIVNTPVKTCNLQVSHVGYEELIHVISNTEKAPQNCKIELVPFVISRKEVTVAAKRYNVWEKAEHVGQIRFSARQLSKLPRLGEVDIFRSLQLLPGVSGATEGSSGLYVRGGTPDQNLVMLDGMTVYHIDHFFGVFSAFNADAIKDIQMFKGGFPAKYGGRISSVVDLTGKTGSYSEPVYKLGLNFLSANALMELPLFENNGSFLLSVRRSYVDLISNGFYTKLFDNATGYEEQESPGMPGGKSGGRSIQGDNRPSFFFYDINSKVTWTPSDRDVLSVSFYSGKDKLDDSQEMENLSLRAFGDINGARESQELSDWGNLGGSLKWSRQWHDRFYSNFLLANSTYFSNFSKNSGFTLSSASDSVRVSRGARSFASEESNQINDLTFRMDNEWHVNGKHRLSTGMWISNVNTDYFATLNDTIITQDIEETSLQTSLYIDDSWQIIIPLKLTLGMRGTYYGQTDQAYFEPRVSMHYSISDQLSLKGAWGYYHQFIVNVTNEDVLNGSRDFWLVADENLRPGFSEHKILGISYENMRYLFEVEGYYKTMENLVEFSRRFQQDADFGNMFFFGDGVSKGVEFLAQKKTGFLTGWVSYTLGDVEHQFPNLNEGEPFSADHDRAHELKVVGTYTHGLWNLSSTWVFASGNAYTSPESQYALEMLDGEVISYIHVGDKNLSRLPDYHRLDFSVSRAFNDRRGKYNGEFGMSVFNFYNHSNVSYRSYDLDTSPIIVTDVLGLGFTPSLFIKINF